MARESFPGLNPTLLPSGTTIYGGKVRDVIDLGDRLLMVTSDRISAFDIIWGEIPGKGEILNRMAVHWLNQVQSILPTALIDVPTPRSMLVKKAKVIPVEVIVRGYITGSAWRAYEKGKGLPGISFPPGLKKNQKLPKPLITPTTKAQYGDHDEPIAPKEVVSRGILGAEEWKKVQEAALGMFELGTAVLQKQGLILVDTKYEFGIYEDELLIIDEVHTPDSSRFWYAEDYLSRFQRGESPRQLDKEFLRSWLVDQGFDPQGGERFQLSQKLLDRVKERYEESFLSVTGEKIQYFAENLQAEHQKITSFL